MMYPTRKENNMETRSDCRIGCGALRPLSAELSCLSRADGSAIFGCGHTQVLAAVYGPTAPRIPSKERSYESTLSVVFKHATDVTVSATTNNSDAEGTVRGLISAPEYGTTVRELERFISDSLSSCITMNKYPRMVIEIVVQVIKADGSLIGTALNAIVLALMDAGISMNTLPVATTFLVSSFSNSNINSLKILFDPSAEEEAKDEYAVIILVTSDSSSSYAKVQQGKEKQDTINYDDIEDIVVLGSMTYGSFQLSSYLSCTESVSRANKAIIAFWRIVVEQKEIVEAKTLWST